MAPESNLNRDSTHHNSFTRLNHEIDKLKGTAALVLRQFLNHASTFLLFQADLTRVCFIVNSCGKESQSFKRCPFGASWIQDIKQKRINLASNLCSKSRDLNKARTSITQKKMFKTPTALFIALLGFR